MIGADEFNYRDANKTGSPTGDISDMEYIETYHATGGFEEEAQILIDIIRPQPRSKQRSASSSKRSGKQSRNTRH